jgi:hypothetical protein
MIVIGVMVYFAVVDNQDQFTSSLTEIITEDTDGNSFTAYSAPSTGSNYTGEWLEVSYPVSSIGNISTWDGTTAGYASTAGTHYSLDNKLIHIFKAEPNNGSTYPMTSFTQINVTYTSKSAVSESDVTSISQMVFELLPILALVGVAAIIIIYVLGFGGYGGAGI